MTRPATTILAKGNAPLPGMPNRGRKEKNPSKPLEVQTFQVTESETGCPSSN